MNKLKIIFCLCLWLVPSLSLAADQGKSSEILCSVVNVKECGSFGDCLDSSAREINIPQFLKIDLAARTMADGSIKDGARKSSIRTMIRENGKIILQGSENGRGFTMIIDEMSGDFSATISEDNFGFIIFGACMAL